MSKKPIFVATHPRACSTAFERVFMTRTDILSCVHEPFGDAFYFGPERLSERYEDDEKARLESGFSESTYKTIFERIEREGNEGKRLFIKDITHYLVPPNGAPASIAPSLGGVKKGVGTTSNGLTTTNLTNGDAPTLNGTSTSTTNGTSPSTNGTTKTTFPPFPYNTLPEPNNPTVIPSSILSQFHFTFLIRHPRFSIPSYWRCTVPPLDSITGFFNFLPSEAGYDELRRVFDFLISQNHVGPKLPNGQSHQSQDQNQNQEQYTNGHIHTPSELKQGEVSITVIDADDLLDNPAGIIEAYCKEVGIDYTPDMLVWDTEEAHARAKEAFEKWRGFHEDAIDSTSLKARSAEHKKNKSTEVEDAEWREKYGEEEAKVIRETVNANLKDYEYLRGFALQV